MKVRNDGGYALVLVLVIITITFTLALSMSGMALSARKQFNKTDGINKATDLAEMGVAHYETLLAKIVTDSNIEADKAVEAAINGANKNGKKNRNLPEYDTYFYPILINKLELTANKKFSIIVENKNSYSVNLTSYTSPADKKITVKFTSEGKTDKESKILTNTVTITKNSISRQGEDAPDQSNFLFNENNVIELIGNYPPKVYLNSTYFEKKLDLRGKNLLTVKGNTYFKDKVFLSGTDTIIIHGDAIFYNKIDNPYVNGNSAFCVYGNTYYVENNKLVEYNPFPSGRKNACPRPQDDEWYINPDKGVQVQY